MAKTALPKDWVFVEVHQIKVTPQSGKAPKVEDLGKIKDITLPKVQVAILNSQMNNTNLRYVIVTPKGNQKASEKEDK